MRKFRSLLLLLLFIGCIAIVYFLIVPKSKPQEALKFSRNFIDSTVADKILENDKMGNVYRLYSYGDSLLVMAEKGIFVTDSNLTIKRVIKGLPDKGSLFYLKFVGDTTAYVNYDSKEIAIKVGDSVKLNTIQGFPNNGYFAHSFFYYDEKLFPSENSVDTGVKQPTKVLIKSWNTRTGSVSTLIDINKLVSNELTKCKECLEQTLDGNFYDIGNDNWIFLFYTAGYFLAKVDGSYRLLQTIDKSPFRVFTTKKINFQKGALIQCSADNDYFVNYSACGRGDGIFVQSGKLYSTKEADWHTAIDIYNKADFAYKGSIRIPMKSKENYPINIAVLGNHIFLAVANEGIIRCKLNR